MSWLVLFNDALILFFINPWVSGVKVRRRNKIEKKESVCVRERERRERTRPYIVDKIR